ncbi:MAG TPA: toll/interleukin-1 receptor domain-containing protein [Burkholderiales bacterium]|nr:toll/interleukin-1 receptor domain-containing protein [Burkholderiales bacterium]
MADIFVSYASPDREVAFRIVSFLEEQGITCWVAPRDVPPGVEYGQAIIDGIGESRALVLILSDQSNDSQFVKKEVERAVSKTKPVLPVRIREVTPSGSLEFFISSAQWVDAFKSPMEQHLLPLVAAIKAIGNVDAAPVRSSALPPPKKKSNAPALAAAAVVIVAVAAGAWLFSKKSEAPVAPVATQPPAPAAPVATAPPAPAPAAPVATAPAAPPAAAPVPAATTPPAPVAKAPAAAPAAPVEAKAPATPKRTDVAFFIGSWCQPYQGQTIRYNVIRTGPDTVMTQVNHPFSSPWDTPPARIKVVKGGFEMSAVDKDKDSEVARFMIVDDATMKLVDEQGESVQGVVRTRCAPLQK